MTFDPVEAAEKRLRDMIELLQMPPLSPGEISGVAIWRMSSEGFEPKPELSDEDRAIHRAIAAAESDGRRMGAAQWLK